MNDIQLN